MTSLFPPSYKKHEEKVKAIREIPPTNIICFGFCVFALNQAHI